MGENQPIIDSGEGGHRVDSANHKRKPRQGVFPLSHLISCRDGNNH